MRDTKTRVMVLGTYHMANPDLDLVRFQIRDTLSPERQTELAMLELRLARFEPTKIAVEAIPDGRLNERYGAFLEGKVELSANEIEQVGFRLAKSLGHAQIYGVDHRSDMDFDMLTAFARAEHQDWFPRLLEELPSEIGRKMQEMDRRFTVSQILAIQNSPDALRFSHSLYIDMLRLNAGDRYPGVEVVADWYRRNMIIYANIRRIIESGDRVLVLFGAGHAKLLRDLVSEASDLELVDPLDYLPETPEFSLG
ncbi:MAG: DUF5694 domain-containing protein [Fimbriimonadales bacterium]